MQITKDTKFTPLNDNVVIERLGAVKRTSVLEIVEKAPPLELGRVVAVGPGFSYFGFDQTLFRSPMEVEEGNLVMFGRYAGSDLGQDMVIVKHGEIIGILPEEYAPDVES